MNPLVLVNTLLPLLTEAPNIISDIEAIFTAHWDKPHVQAAAQGLQQLAAVVGNVAANAAPAAASPVPAPLAPATTGS